MKIQVLCFAMVRQLLGTDALEIELPEGATVEELRAQLIERAAGLADLPVAYAVNQTYQRGAHVLADGDEVALIPPISGGEGDGPEPEDTEHDDRQAADRFELCEGVLDPRPLEAEARTDHDGAVVTFSGVTRDHNEGAAVRGLSYEAYAPMAAKVVASICADARQRYEIGRIRIAHRLGEVPVGEASILVVVASAHRGPAFEACRYVMDRLKAEAPIFKREELAGPDGCSRWIGNLPEVEPGEP